MDKNSRTTVNAASAPGGTQCLSRAFLLLKVLSTHLSTGWRLSDLAEETGLSRGTVHRVLDALVRERLACRVPGSRRYSLGPLAWELGKAAAPHFSLDALAAPVLARLAAETRSIVFMNVRSGNETVCVARHEGRHALKAYTVGVGTRRPLALSAGGVAILIALPRAEQRAAEAANLRSIARSDESRQEAVRRMLRRSRALGFGCNFEDIIPRIAALGVAIRSPTNDPVASISIAASSATLTEARQAEIVGRLQAAACEIEPMLAVLRF
ncbi:MAG: IclR family transcriptional regulator [Burkholderiaceae bacterium]|nr:IclR family transcriptional regulator [Burkholderiaceae bacterium]